MNTTIAIGNSSAFIASIDNKMACHYCVDTTIAVLCLVSVLIYLCYEFTLLDDEESRWRNITNIVDHSFEGDVGLDEYTILSFPKMFYPEAKLIMDKRYSVDSTATLGCSICLGDYKDDDMLRVLPNCHHSFHLICIDPWLRMHPTCPLCRTFCTFKKWFH